MYGPLNNDFLENLIRTLFLNVGRGVTLVEYLPVRALG